MSGDEGRGLLGRLRSWLGGLFGGSAAESGTATAGAGTCAVCGTPVEDPADGCPLCGATDVEPADGTADPSGGEAGSPAPERRSVPGTADEEAERLRDVRAPDEEGDDGSGVAGGAGDENGDGDTADGAGAGGPDGEGREGREGG
ncbi:MAG: hypothetical protein ABEH40_07790 [Haloferacaceae archaeon]